MSDPKPIEHWRKQIEANPGSVRLICTEGCVFIPFFFCGEEAYGKDHEDNMMTEPIATKAWIEDKAKVVRWLWASDKGLLTSDLRSESENKSKNDVIFYRHKLEWSRTESDE